MSNGWTNLNTNLFKLMDFNWYTIRPDGTAGSGLYSGDDVIIRINYSINAYSVMLITPYIVKIHGLLNGQVCTWTASLGSGRESGRQNVDLKFSGKMPVGKGLAGTLVFEGYAATIWGLIVGRGVPFAEVPITIPNLDDIAPEPPDGMPPAVCTEGQERCEGFDLYICKNSQWIVKEYNSPECGYTPEPICTNGDERCVGTKLQVCVGDHWEVKERNSARCGYVPPDEDVPTPPDEDDEDDGIVRWFERNKTAIIIGSAVALAIALVILFTRKLKFQKPVTGIKSPIARRPK